MFSLNCLGSTEQMKIEEVFPVKVYENELSKESLAIHKAAITLSKDIMNKELQISYLKIFPSDFSIFLKVFHPKKFDQLYSHSHVYIDYFIRFSLQFPDLGAEKYVSLVSSACFDADAPNYFRTGLEEFIEKYPAKYKVHYSKLSQAQKNNVKLFLNASFHPHDNTAGFCGF